MIGSELEMVFVVDFFIGGYLHFSLSAEFLCASTTSTHSLSNFTVYAAE